MAAKTATRTKLERQPKRWSSAPPSSGEKPGAAAMAIMISDIARASAAPENRSRAMARESTDVAQAPAAWTTRPTSSPGRSVASAHQTLPAKNTANPIKTGHRRPSRSEIGPTTSWPRANTARKTVMADVTAEVDTFSATAICGKEGSRMLVASVPVAANDARTAICKTVEDASSLVADGASIATVWSAMVAPACLNDEYHIKRQREAPMAGAELSCAKRAHHDREGPGPTGSAPGRFTDHLWLPRQRHGRRQPDHQRLGGEDRSRQIEAHLRAIEAADDGAECRAERARTVAHDVDGGDSAEQRGRRHRLPQRGGRDHPQDRTGAEQEEAEAS